MHHITCTDLPADDDYDYYDYDYEFDEEHYCPDRDQLILICLGINCIRDPYDNETCMQCIEACNGQIWKDKHGVS